MRLVHPRMTVKELSELKSALASGEVDFVISTEPIEMAGTVATALGYEENVLVKSALHDDVPEVYLDHDASDLTTYQFFKHQGQKQRHQKFLKGIYKQT